MNFRRCYFYYGRSYVEGESAFKYQNDYNGLRVAQRRKSSIRRHDRLNGMSTASSF